MNILNNGSAIKISDMAKEYKVSNRTIRYDLDTIDQLLIESRLHPLHRKPGTGIILSATDEERKLLMQKIKKVNMYNYVPSQEERKNLILSELFLQRGYITINQLADNILVSRGTIIKDLDKVREWSINHELKLEAVSKHGIKISGEEKKLRQVIIELFMETIDINYALNLIKINKYNKINLGMSNQFKKLIEEMDIDYIKSCLKIAEEELQTIFSDDAFLDLLMHLIVTIKRIELDKVVILTKKELGSLSITKEFAAASNIAKMIEEHFHINITFDEIGYISLNLLSSSITATKINEREDWLDFQLLTRNLIKEVGNRVNINFIGDNQLFYGFLDHLRPAIYRVRNGLKLKNPLLKEIKENFYNLFEHIKLNVKPIEEFAGGAFDDEEIGYFTMHFGASMERMKSRLRIKKNLLIVCGSGVGTAKMLSAKLQSIFDVNIIAAVAYHQVNDILKQNEIDLIVSTFPIEIDEVPSIYVNPILTDHDINQLNYYLTYSKKTEITVSEMLKIIKKHCRVNNLENLTEDLSRLFSTNYNNTCERGVEPMLKDLLTEKTIKLNIEAKDWEDAVKKGGELLEQAGSIEKRYIDAMINSVKEIGPYIVIAPGIAMPHARPEEGAKEIGMSLITLKTPVNFGNKENDPVTIVVCLCAIDHSTHLKAMSELVELLGDDDKVNKINTTSNVNDILSMIEEG